MAVTIPQDASYDVRRSFEQINDELSRLKQENIHLLEQLSVREGDTENVRRDLESSQNTPSFLDFNDIFRGSGAAHAIGHVPDPGASAASIKFLNEDGTWTNHVDHWIFDATTDPSVDYSLFHNTSDGWIYLTLPSAGTKGVFMKDSKLWIEKDFTLADSTAPTGSAGRGHIWHDSGNSRLEYKNDDNVALPLVNRPSCSLSETGAGQVISNGTFTVITWDLEYSDTDGFHSTSSNTSRITIPTGLAGNYIFFGSIYVTETNETGIRIIRLLKNGASDWGQHRTNPNNGGTGPFIFRVSWKSLIEVADGDYFELQYYQSSGGNQTTVTGIHAGFGCIRLGDF